MSNLIPVAMDRNELYDVLIDIAERVTRGDSFEGNIEYFIPDEDAADLGGWPSADAEFWVRGVYRIGNTFGQGGTRMIGMVPGA